METLQAQAERAKLLLRQAAPGIAVVLAQTGLALVTLRIQSRGLPGRQYSTNPLPKFYFRPINAGGRAYVKKEKKPTYKGFRAASGLPSEYVTLTYSGRTIRSLQAQGAGTSGTQYTARVVASDAESALIIGYLGKQYGDFLAPNAAEAAEVSAVGQRALDKILQQAFGPK